MMIVFGLFLAICVRLSCTQDVRVPEDLLGLNRTRNSTGVDYGENNSTAPQPDALIDSRIPIIAPPQRYPIYGNPPPCALNQPRRRYYYPPAPCEIVAPRIPGAVPAPPPTYYPPPNIVVPEAEPEVESQTEYIPPIIDSKFNPAEKDELRFCPLGSVQNGNECVAENSNECPPGYTWENDHCVLSQTMCPLNFDWDGSSCVQRRICPVNHVWKGGRCVLPTPECPAGWRWNGNTCEVEEIQCQPGSVLRGHECVIETITCPSGYTRSGNECVKQKPICPSGTTLNEAGFCVHVTLRCPQGSEMIDNECKSTIVSCPPGTYRDGNRCYRPITVRPTRKPITTLPTRRPQNPGTVPRQPSCPSGFTLYNNMCYRCPQPYNLCQDQCVRHECGEHTGVPDYVPGVPDYVPGVPDYVPGVPEIPGYPGHPIHPGVPGCTGGCSGVPGCASGCSDYPGYPNYPTIPNINVNIHSKPSHRHPGQGVNIVNKVEPINNTIHNFNNITHPVTLNNVNYNNIFIYTATQCRDGSIKTVIVKNNETINGCVEVDHGNGEVLIEDEEATTGSPEKCCEVVTPRQCTTRKDHQWICTHKRYRYCGKFCIASRLYLKPPATTYNNNVLTFAPPPNSVPITPCFGRSCPPIDCSGCINGSYDCSAQCYTYPCNHSECHYFDQEDFCGTVGGHICE